MFYRGFRSICEIDNSNLRRGFLGHSRRVNDSPVISVDPNEFKVPDLGGLPFYYKRQRARVGGIGEDSEKGLASPLAVFGSFATAGNIIGARIPEVEPTRVRLPHSYPSNIDSMDAVSYLDSVYTHFGGQKWH